MAEQLTLNWQRVKLKFRKPVNLQAKLKFKNQWGERPKTRR